MFERAVVPTVLLFGVVVEDDDLDKADIEDIDDEGLDGLPWTIGAVLDPSDTTCPSEGLLP